MIADEAGDPRFDLAFSLISETEVPRGIESDDLKALVACVLASERAAGPWEITIALVRDDRLQALHRDFMRIDTPTDIMTFPTGEGDDEPRGGELVISVDHARTEAGTWGLAPEDEIRFLVAHGLLHLLGWRDETEEQRQAMLERQQQLLDQWRTADREVG